MDEQFNGIHVYGGGPQRHCVFSSQPRRQQRTARLISILAVVLLAIAVVLLAHSAFANMTNPADAQARDNLAQANGNVVVIVDGATPGSATVAP